MAESKTTTKKAEGKARRTTPSKAAARKSEEEGPELSEHGGVTPEWHNDPDRNLDAAELEARSELEARGQVAVAGDPQSHREQVINFSGLMPETDFEVKIEGPTAGNWWGTLKSDPWGQAQLIWRSPVGGDFKITAKGEDINVSGEFSIVAANADEDYRREKREKAGKGRGKSGAKRGNIGTVEEPATMGDKSSAEQKYQPTEEELADPALYDPSFQSAVHDPEDQGDPSINKEPHPEGSAQFNYRVPGEAETIGEESKEGDPETQDERQAEATEEAAEETADAKSKGKTAKGKASEHAGMSAPMSQEQVDGENAQTGAKEDK